MAIWGVWWRVELNIYHQWIIRTRFAVDGPCITVTVTTLGAFCQLWTWKPDVETTTWTTYSHATGRKPQGIDFSYGVSYNNHWFWGNRDHFGIYVWEYWWKSQVRQNVVKFWFRGKLTPHRKFVKRLVSQKALPYVVGPRRMSLDRCMKTGGAVRSARERKKAKG
jgi:hypothetical protein